MIPPEFIIPAIGAAASAGAAWGAVKVSLNGTRTRIKAIQGDLEEHREDLRVHMREEHTDYMGQLDRLARVETKIDLLLLDKRLR